MAKIKMVRDSQSVSVDVSEVELYKRAKWKPDIKNVECCPVCGKAINEKVIEQEKTEHKKFGKVK